MRRGSDGEGLGPLRLAACRRGSLRVFAGRDAVHLDGLDPREVRPRRYDRQTMLRHQRWILDAYGFRPFGTEARRFLQREIESMVRSQLKPKLIFYRAVDLLIREKIAAPGYHRLSQLILGAWGTQKGRLTATAGARLSPEGRRLLDGLLEKPSADDSSLGHRYRLTLLKRCSQSTRPGQIRE